jgi:hypothetical protein
MPAPKAAATVEAPQAVRNSHDLMREALRNFGSRAPSGALAGCIAEHVNVLDAMDRFYERVLAAQVRFEAAPARYASQAEDVADAMLEAKHRRTMAALRRQKEELKAQRELQEYGGGLDPDENEVLLDAQHKRTLAELRRKKEKIEAQRELVSAKHGLESERALKSVRFTLGRRRLESKIAEVDVGVAVARNAAGQDGSDQADNESGEVGILHQLIERKQKEIEEAEADGKDTTVHRLQLGKLKELLALA